MCPTNALNSHVGRKDCNYVHTNGSLNERGFRYYPAFNSAGRHPRLYKILIKIRERAAVDCIISRRDSWSPAVVPQCVAAATSRNHSRLWQVIRLYELRGRTVAADETCGSLKLFVYLWERRPRISSQG
jgi:hypothetical protein